MNFDTHLCLVSAQATPNLASALDAELKPRRVILVTSPDMQRQSAALAAVLKTHGIKVERLDIADAYDYPSIEDCLLDWILKNDTDSVALNLTGGTKLMAIAAQSVFSSAGKPIFYVNADSDEVIFLGRRDLTHRLESRVKLRDYLGAHGYTLAKAVDRPAIPASLRDLTDRLIDHVGSAGGALGQLNWLAQEAKGQARSPILDKRQSESKKLGEIIDLFEEAQLLTQEQNALRFQDEDARVFANGGWLEFYVYRLLADLAPQERITDYAINLELVAPDGSTRNELDAVFLRRNTLHIIETKASNLGAAGSSGASKATEAIYKLEALLKTGGLRTRAMLVDYRGALSAADRARATASKIRVVSAAQLKQLKSELCRWMNE